MDSSLSPLQKRSAVTIIIVHMVFLLIGISYFLVHINVGLGSVPYFDEHHLTFSRGLWETTALIVLGCTSFLIALLSKVRTQQYWLVRGALLLISIACIALGGQNLSLACVSPTAPYWKADDGVPIVYERFAFVYYHSTALRGCNCDSLYLERGIFTTSFHNSETGFPVYSTLGGINGFLSLNDAQESMTNRQEIHYWFYDLLNGE